VGFDDETEGACDGPVLESELEQAEAPTRVESKIAMTAKRFMTHLRINHPILKARP
jgi:hypothetical protein